MQSPRTSLSNSVDAEKYGTIGLKNSGNASIEIENRPTTLSPAQIEQEISQTLTIPCQHDPSPF